MGAVEAMLRVLGQHHVAAARVPPTIKGEQHTTSGLGTRTKPCPDAIGEPRQSRDHRGRLVFWPATIVLPIPPAGPPDH